MSATSSMGRNGSHDFLPMMAVQAVDLVWPIVIAEIANTADYNDERVISHE